MPDDDDNTPAVGPPDSLDNWSRDDKDRWSHDPFRTAAMEWAMTRMGAWYRWCGKGEIAQQDEWDALKAAHPSVELPACRQLFDCSGFCLSALIAVKLVPEHWLHSHSADGLFNSPSLAVVDYEHLQPMDLIFWGRPPEKGNPKPRATHVAFLWEDHRVLGAMGGNQSTTTLEIALKARAKVQFRSSIMYRQDTLGFRAIPNSPLQLSAL